MTVHVKMLLKDGVSFRLLTAVDPVNIQVIAADPELGGVPVLTISNPPSKHVIAADAWIMNEKGDTISKIDYKALTKVGYIEPMKPIAQPDAPEELIAGTPIFKPEKLEEQHRGAEYGAFIGMDFYPFYCISPTLVREHGVYASDEIIEALKKTKLVSYVFLSLLKANADKYNPALQTVQVGGESNLVEKSVIIDPPDSSKLFEKVLSPESIDLLQDQLKQSTDVVFVIINSPGIIDNLMSSVLVIEQSQGKYTCTAHYAGLISDPKDFTAEQLKAFIGNDEFTIFTASRDETFTTLTLLPHTQSQPDNYQTALARKRFYEEHPQLKEVLSSPQMSVAGIVSALRESSVSIKTLAVQGLLAEDALERTTSNTDAMKQELFDSLDNIPLGIAKHLSEDGLGKFKAFVIDHVKGLLRASVQITTTCGDGFYSDKVKISTAQHLVEFPAVDTLINKGETYPPQSLTTWSVYRGNSNFAFALVEEN